jgi:hypothetical protein
MIPFVNTWIISSFVGMPSEKLEVKGRIAMYASITQREPWGMLGRREDFAQM